MKNILIIGGTRFIGPELIQNLLKEKCEVTVFNRGNDYNITLPSSVIHITGDRRKPETMKEISKKRYDFVYDLCCFNKVDAKNLLDTIQVPSNIIFLSTAAVYKKPQIYPLYETSPLGDWDSFGDYGTQKVDAENVFQAYTNRHGIKLTIFRPVYLLGNNNYFDRENFYLSRIINGDPILVPGKGNALIQFAFLEETAYAFSIIPKLQSGQIEILNIAGSEYISVRNFINLFSEVTSLEAKVVELDSSRFNMEEEHFYDNIYPFPNLTFIVSNQKIISKYNIDFISLRTGIENIYNKWKQTWSGKTKMYPREIEILKVLNLL